MPKELFAKAGAAQVLPACVGSPWPKARARASTATTLQSPTQRLWSHTAAACARRHARHARRGVEAGTSELL